MSLLNIMPYSPETPQAPKGRKSWSASPLATPPQQHLRENDSVRGNKCLKRAVETAEEWGLTDLPSAGVY